MKFIIEVPDDIIEKYYGTDEDDVRLELDHISPAEAAMYDILEAIQYDCIMEIHEDAGTVKISLDTTKQI
jgi:hypothetical protein